jgi:hypothetical protein
VDALYVVLGLIVVVAVVLEVLAHRAHLSLKAEFFRLKDDLGQDITEGEQRITALLHVQHASVVQKVAAIPPAGPQMLVVPTVPLPPIKSDVNAPVVEPPDPYKARSAEGGTFGGTDPIMQKIGANDYATIAQYVKQNDPSHPEYHAAANEYAARLAQDSTLGFGPGVNPFVLLAGEAHLLDGPGPNPPQTVKEWLYAVHGITA